MYTYEQVTGRWLNNDVFLGNGCSGKGEHRNNPRSEGIVNEGPIPVGHYIITGPLYKDPKLGRDVLKLIPDVETAKRIVSLGRDPWSFRLHGDNPKHVGESSDGCVVISNDIRRAVAAALPIDRDLEVVTGYENRDTDNPTRPTAV